MTKNQKRVSIVNKGADYDSKKVDVLKGHNFQGLLDPPNLVRVFVSSTFHDFVHERNYLYNNAFRFLETWCRERGLEFQVVDLRWGVRPGTEAFDGAAAQCLREVEACQKVSVGPNFVAFLGDRYGFRPLPPVIPQAEWKIIMDNVADKVQQKSVSAVYQLDENADPPEYLLNTDQEDDSKLRDIFEKAATSAVSRGSLSEDKAYKYFASMTEQEIWKGILTVEEPEKSSLCFIRNFTNFETLKPEAINKQIGKYLDLTNGNIRNDAATKLLTNLKKFQVPVKLDSSNVFSFSLKADLEQGLNPTLPEHQEYLEKLNKLMTDRFQDMITEGIKRQSKTALQDDVYREVCQHAAFCLTKCKLFTGRKSFITNMIKALSDNQACQPVIVWGESGVGKTAAMAKLIFEISEQLKPKTNVVYRFLGITAGSSTVDQLLLSLSQQIAQIYNLPQPTVFEKDFNNLKPFFANLLKSVGEKATDKPLIIAFDSMDQLSPVYGAYSMNWLPTELPKGVTIVLSAQPQTHNILARLRSRIKPVNVYQIQPMSNKSAGDVIKMLVEQSGRKLQTNQMAAIERVVTKNSSPLLIHLIALEALKWRSFTPIDNTNRLPSTIRDAVQYLFDRLERTHGKVLVGRALGYLVLSKNGLSEKELQEILSLDDDVLQDLYQFWEPPNQKQIQLPPMQWARFKYDMTDFISQRTSDDMTVITLYHQQFIEVILARYVNSAGERKRMYKILADFFAGTWDKEPKALKLLVNNKEMLYNPLRRVRSQPLKLGGRYNLRKLNLLPYYLTKCGSFEVLNQSVFFNYEWLNTKYKACGMKSILDDFALLDRDEMDNPLNCIKQAVRLAKTTLEFPENQDVLATEFLGRLKMVSTEQPVIRRLLEQCDSYCSNSQETMLVPLNQCFLAANGLLLATLVGHKAGVLQILQTPDQSLLISCSLDKTVRIWDLETDTLMHLLEINLPVCLAITDGATHLFIAFKDSALVYDLKMGILLDRIEPPHEFPKKTKEVVNLGNTKDIKPTVVQCQVDQKYLVISYGTFVDFYEISTYNHQKRFEISLNVAFMKLDTGLILVGAGLNSLLVIDVASLRGKPCPHDCVKLLTCYVSLTDKGRTVVSVCETEGKTSLFSNGKPVLANFLNHAPTVSSFMSPLLAVGAKVKVAIVHVGSLRLALAISLSSDVTQLQFVQINNDPSLLVGCQDATVRLYDSKGDLKRYLTGFWSGPTNFHLTNSRLVTSSVDDPYIKMWELATHWGPDTPMIVSSLNPKPAVFCRPDGTFVVCSKSMEERSINVADSNGINSNFDVDTELVGMTMISPRELLMLDSSGQAVIRNVEKKGQIVKRLMTLEEPIIFYDFSYKFRTVAFLTKSQKVVMMELPGNAIMDQHDTTLALPTDEPCSEIYVVLNSCLVLTGKNMHPRFINNRGTLLYELKNGVHSDGQCTAKCSATNGKMFAYYNNADDEIHIHDLVKQSFVSTISKTGGAVSCLNITDDGTFLLAGMSTSDNINLAQRQIFLYTTAKGNFVRKFFLYSPVMQIHSFGLIVGVTTGLGYFGCFRLQSSITSEKISSDSGYKVKSPGVRRKSATSSLKTVSKKSKTCNIL